MAWNPQITDYSFSPGKILVQKYEVVSQVAKGWEGELYMLSERSTGIERTAKFFFPHRNPRNRVANYYAKKLHRLRHCNILMQYRTQETISVRGQPVTFLVSDLVEGDLLSDFLAEQPLRRLNSFEALHLLHALAKGVEQVHRVGEYHGHLTIDNIVVRREGLGFRIKLMDLFYATGPKPEYIREDVCDLIRVFYECLGGARFYGRLPPEIKAICCGLKKSLIIEKFRTAGQLRYYLETMQWL